MTKIQWAAKTINPIHLIRENGEHGGHWCRKISEGCTFCYAEEQNQSNYFKFASHKPYTGQAPENLILDTEVLKQVQNSKKGQKIFVGSMTDIFGGWVPDEWLDKIFAYLAIAQQHTFQVLTKRPERMQDYFTDSSTPDRIEEAGYEWTHNMDFNWPLDNVWLGTSVENQKMAEKRIPYLLQTPAKIRFLSCEPLLEKLDLGEWLVCQHCKGEGQFFKIIQKSKTGTCGYVPCPECNGKRWNDKLHWVIAGGESGNRARPCRVEWISSIVRQCADAGVACFVKQLGAKPYLGCEEYIPDINDVKLRSRKGDNPDEWHESVKIQQYPQ